MKLTEQDFADLIDAVEAWENKDFAGEMMGDLIGAMIGDRSPEAKLKLDAERAERKRKSDEARQMRKERSVILRAKLMELRDETAILGPITNRVAANV